MNKAVGFAVCLFLACTASRDDYLPGVKGFPSFVIKKIREERMAQPDHYKPRTRHFDSAGKAKYTNRLMLESSPYLRQHAHNPVNWYPWGKEALDEAKKTGRPVFLSVGYSTCHWCHVMEEESFEDEEIAKFLNENYVSIKVDREERPDVDSIYMTAVQAITGGGGWPMSVWLFPDGRPFYGGTYFPARDGDRGAHVGFLTLLKKLKDAYDTDRERVAESAKSIVDAIESRLKVEAGKELPDSHILKQAISFYKERWDSLEGGMRGAPKFPSSLPIRLLHRYFRRTGDKEVLKQAKLTLIKMARGGMYDQVGGGFHRYSTDEIWLVPHFEKMLYDNALLVLAYLEMSQLDSDPIFERVVREVLDYITREMTSSGGGFYSATDADSLTPKGHREEGYFFTWSEKELKASLSKGEFELIEKVYGVTRGGNFEGRNIFYRNEELSEKQWEELKPIRSKLYELRKKKPAPLRDDKILSSWNGLMISAFARAGFVLGEAKYVEMARRAGDAIFRDLYKGGVLHRSFKDGKLSPTGFLDDYAFMIEACLNLFEVTSERKWLERAIELDSKLSDGFEDPEGGYFLTSKDQERLLVRDKPSHDGAEPSGNSIAILNLLRLSELTSEQAYFKRAEAALRAFSGILSQFPAVLSEMLLSLDFYTDCVKEIVLVGEDREMLDLLRSQYLPNSVLALAKSDEVASEISSKVPFAKGKKAVGGKATAYVCYRGTCLKPASSAKELKTQLQEVEKYPDSR